jgi:hypothetical protein
MSQELHCSIYFKTYSGFFTKTRREEGFPMNFDEGRHGSGVNYILSQQMMMMILSLSLFVSAITHIRSTTTQTVLVL